MESILHDENRPPQQCVLLVGDDELVRAAEVALAGSFRVIVTEGELPADEAIDAVLLSEGLGADAVAAHVDAARRRGIAPCLVLARDCDEAAIELVSASGADTVVWLPIDPSHLRALVEGPRARPAIHDGSSFVLGESGVMRELWRMVLLAARRPCSVLITGETGAGKEVVAQALHRFSPRRNAAFVAINCAAIPEALIESELFGHEKGAFTGASARRPGRFELADGGTLLLDEVAELPLAMQAKLLRVLQDHRFDRLGGVEPVAVDVRVVAATNRDLAAEVERGRFRADLYYRLGVITVHVPPVREHRRDVLDLFAHFLGAQAALERREVPSIGAEVERVLLRHHWPGNVREISNVTQHILTVAGAHVEPSHLPEYLRGERAPAAIGASLAGLSLEEVERIAILQSCEMFGTVKRAAEVLGVSERKMHYRLKRYREEGHLPGAEAAPEPPPETLRVLLAEDDDELRSVICDFLVSEGCEVLSVASGAALLDRLLAQESAPTDLVISDVRMPGMTGLQMLSRAREKGVETPVILISAYGDHAARQAAVDGGALVLLDKPLDLRELRRAIGSVPQRPGLRVEVGT